MLVWPEGAAYIRDLGIGNGDSVVVEIIDITSGAFSDVFADIVSRCQDLDVDDFVVDHVFKSIECGRIINVALIGDTGFFDRLVPKIGEGGDCNGDQNSEDRDHDHHLYERKPIVIFHISS